MSNIDWDSATNFAVDKTKAYVNNDANTVKLINSVFNDKGCKPLMEKIVNQCLIVKNTGSKGNVLVGRIINIIIFSVREIRALAATANVLVNVNNDGIKFIVYGILNFILFTLIGKDTKDEEGDNVIDELNEMFDICWTAANINPKELLANTKSFFSKCCCCSASAVAVKQIPSKQSTPKITPLSVSVNEPAQ